MVANSQIPDRWVCLSTRVDLGEGFKNILLNQGIDVTLVGMSELKAQLDENSSVVLVVIADSWPKDIPSQSEKFICVWLATGSLKDSGPGSAVDFGMSYAEFMAAPDWYARQIMKISQLKDYGHLSREWRDTMVEKLKAKAVILEQMNARLQKLSITDELTGVYNHRFFNQVLRDEMERAVRYKFSLSLLMIDIDHFKQVNDQYGHLVGDRVLAQVASEIRKAVRRVDTVCRYGGEEFAVILPMTGIQAARDLGERIRHQIASMAQNKTALQDSEKKFPVKSVHVSVGVAAFPDHGQTAEGLLDAADRALYVAKTGGRNQVVSAQGLSR